ncbi:MAG: hypothetical protein ACOC85_03970 [Thermoplasmatota archaeon]
MQSKSEKTKKVSKLRDEIIQTIYAKDDLEDDDRNIQIKKAIDHRIEKMVINSFLDEVKEVNDWLKVEKERLLEKKYIPNLSKVELPDGVYQRIYYRILAMARGEWTEYSEEYYGKKKCSVCGKYLQVGDRYVIEGKEFMHQRCEEKKSKQNQEN